MKKISILLSSLLLLGVSSTSQSKPQSESHSKVTSNGSAVMKPRQVIDEVELPFLKKSMKHTPANQSCAANCLGSNRSTLRSKLKRHGVI